jgi:hypothetical protein
MEHSKAPYISIPNDHDLTQINNLYITNILLRHFTYSVSRNLTNTFFHTARGTFGTLKVSFRSTFR